MLIVFTGIDGSGKTTQARLLIEDMRNRGIDVDYVWCRWEPWLLRPIISLWKRNKVQDHHSSKGNIYRQVQKEKSQMLKNPVLRFLWFSFFIIEYGLQVVWKVRLRQLKGGMIVSDRMFYDSFIDQAINLGYNGDRLISKLESFYTKLIFPSPTMTIYIDCPEEIALRRKNDAPDIEYLRERRILYKKLSDRYRWKIIDGSLPVDIIFKDIKRLVYSKCPIL